MPRELQHAKGRAWLTLSGSILLLAGICIGFYDAFITNGLGSIGSDPYRLPIADLVGSDIQGQLSGCKIVVRDGITCAQFTREEESRITYFFEKGFPTEGTFEMWILVQSGYGYHDFILSEQSDNVLVFTTDSYGGDVTWPGTTSLWVSESGEVRLFMARSKYNKNPIPPLVANGPSFRFGEWQALGFTYGSQGQKIMVNGKIVAQDQSRVQVMGASGTQSRSLDNPTVGESISGYWKDDRYDGGFEGFVARIRVSNKQNDWLYARAIR